MYWLCAILGEPGAETTPFADPMNDMGWEDDLLHPRSACGELSQTLGIAGLPQIDLWRSD